ncbi:kynurenine formamidase [Halobacillus andaensis]|uniref:Kynurenine formamidase n=1 Tax=Halobacillus andaensis TaxID=1176239 RepID=A0A917B4F6_HALAA|nr:arylformamidase [Halobacillus andaensis]MBP2004508.1 arylformamidase [Halobacillus andaensis]GGF21119.1 kynurenine formamidase [Halobacillus andaensis]
MKLIDISMSLNAKTPPWPGDQSYSYKLTWGMEETGSVNVGQFQSSNHLGTHVDAPFHYDNDGSTIGELPIERFIGEALVVNMEGKSKIEASDLEPFQFEAVDKVLFRTLSWEDRSEFPGEYTVIAEDVAPFLNERGINLIGVDTPSVDPETSKELPAHQSLNQEDILILEGLELSHVAPGVYELMAFPLKMDEADGSPVRAVLRQK